MKCYITAREGETLEDIVNDYLRRSAGSHELYVSAAWAESAGPRVVVITDDTPEPEPAPGRSSRWTKKDPPARAITR